MPQHNPSSRQNVDAASRPQFSFGKQLSVPSPDPDDDKDKQEGKTATCPTSDWLDETHLTIRQDQITSQKELSLIKMLLEDIESGPKSKKLDKTNAINQTTLLNACKEYTASRCNLLDERLRQVNYWLRSKEMGRQVPDRAPDEWRSADIEWRTWLGDQASRSGIVSPLGTPTDCTKDVAWRVLGPVAYLLDVIFFLEGFDN